MHAPRSSLLTSDLLTSDLPAIAADFFARLRTRLAGLERETIRARARIA